MRKKGKNWPPENIEISVLDWYRSTNQTVLFVKPPKTSGGNPPILQSHWLFCCVSCFRVGAEKVSFFSQIWEIMLFFGAFGCLAVLVLVIVATIVVLYTVVVLVVAGFGLVSLLFVSFIHFLYFLLLFWLFGCLLFLLLPVAFFCCCYCLFFYFLFCNCSYCVFCYFCCDLLHFFYTCLPTFDINCSPAQVSAETPTTSADTPVVNARAWVRAWCLTTCLCTYVRPCWLWSVPPRAWWLPVCVHAPISFFHYFALL